MSENAKEDMLRYLGRLQLSMWLHEIMAHDTDYPVRYGLVLHAMAAAHSAGYRTGIAIDPAEPAWPVVYIELPTGQVSWHMPAHGDAYDGHTTSEKYFRVQRWIHHVDNERGPNPDER